MPDGNLLILRDLFVNEEAFHWSDVCDDAKLPHCYTLAVVLDPEKVRIRVATQRSREATPSHKIRFAHGGQHSKSAPIGATRTD